MSKIKNITLEFACTEKLSEKLFCDKCSHHLIDFTSKTPEELQTEIDKSTKPVCGIFKKSQMSEQFLKYAAATFIATAMAMPSQGNHTIKDEHVLKELENVTFRMDEHIFYGFVIDEQAEPVDGYKQFFQTIQSRLIYPEGLLERGNSFVEVMIDQFGQMYNIRLMKGFNDLADNEALRVVGSLNHPFNPGKQKGVPVKTKLIIPVLFDPEERRRINGQLLNDK